MIKDAKKTKEIKKTKTLVSDNYMIKDVIKAFKDGEIVLIFDNENREGETDMIVSAEHITPEHMKIMRNDTGGLFCVLISSEISDKLGIPFMEDIMETTTHKYPVLGELSSTDIPYDNKSAFSITVNHRKTFTGITDNDRTCTIKELTLLCRNEYYNNFRKHFRAPGHVTLLRAAEGHVLKRQGHTEMSITLTEMAGTTPVAVCCEMMDDKSGGSMIIDDVVKYAEKEGLLFLSGYDFIKAYNKFRNKSYFKLHNENIKDMEFVSTGS